MSVLNILNQLQQTNSRNEKKKILKDLETDDVMLLSVFLNVAQSTYDGRLNYWITDPTDTENLIEESDAIDWDEFNDPTMSDALLWLQTNIVGRRYTGHLAQTAVYHMWRALNEDDAEVFRRVIKRDLRCGISAKTINQIFPNTIYEHPYMRCSSFNEKNLKNISFPCYSQTKMDGLYIDLSVDQDGIVRCQTRNGQMVDQYMSEQTIGVLSQHPGLVFQGEALVLDEDGYVMSRKQSNGELNRSGVDPENISFYLWDAVDYDCWINHKADKTPYCDRLDKVMEVLEADQLLVVSTELSNSKEDIIDFFRLQRLNGQEGSVVKQIDGVWKPGTSKEQIKVKVIFDCDLSVTDYKEGTGKYEGMLGSLKCESADGQLSVWVGAGYKDNERQQWYENPDDMLGRIVTVRGNDVVWNEDDKSKYCIFLPRFVEFRIDKEDADTTDGIREQVESFTNALDLIQ